MASLNPSTYHLIDQRALARMKPTAFLINMARGAIVDQDALRSALLDERIAGAGLDVFDPEPIDLDDPILSLDTVTLAPHSLNWTADFTRDVSASALGAVIDVAAGRLPATALNPEVQRTEAYRRKRAGQS
jgi:phosphoglycerate dehydrogenase-like enzyme